MSGRIDGIVADLGLSSFQLDDPLRGFSFQSDGPLDMRFDPSGDVPSAADLLRDLPEASLEALLRRFGDEPHARRIARGIVRQRDEEPVTTTRQLVELVTAVKPRPRGHDGRLHPATRVFQALRIAVNAELEGLEDFVRDAVSVLAPGGRLVVIAFHGGEDRPIKNALRDLAGRCTCPPELPQCTCGRVARVKVLTQRPLRPSLEEVQANPRARSARLRAAERLAA